MEENNQQPEEKENNQENELSKEEPINKEYIATLLIIIISFIYTACLYLSEWNIKLRDIDYVFLIFAGIIITPYLFYFIIA